MANLIAILESDLFLWGLATGGMGVIGVRGYLGGQATDRPLPVGGLIIALATMVAVELAGDISPVAWAGLVAIWLLTLTAERSGAGPVVVAIASIPGAVAVSLAASGEPQWVRVVVVVAVPLIGLLIDDFESRYGHRGLAVLYFGLAAFGVFLAVPDTDWARTLFAVMLPVSFLAWPKVRVTMGRSGAYMAVALLALFAGEGGIGRPASVIGALACFGLLILEPVFVRLRPWGDGLLRSWRHAPELAILASVPQLIIVFITSRVAAHEISRLRSAMIVMTVFVAAFVSLNWMARRSARVGVGRANDP